MLGKERGKLKMGKNVFLDEAKEKRMTRVKFQIWLQPVFHTNRTPQPYLHFVFMSGLSETNSCLNITDILCDKVMGKRIKLFIIRKKKFFLKRFERLFFLVNCTTNNVTQSSASKDKLFQFFELQNNKMKFSRQLKST